MSLLGISLEGIYGLMYNKIIIEYTIYIRLRMSSSILFPTNEYTTSSKVNLKLILV